MSSTPPLRIALVASKYPPVVGGSEIATQRMARGLAARGHEVTVVTLARDGMPDEERDGARLRIRRAIRPLAVGPLWGMTYMRGVERELRALGQLDVIHCRQAYLHTVSAVRVSRATGAACLSTVCATGPLLDFRSIERLRFSRVLLRAATYPPSTFVALSTRIEEESREFFAAHGLEAPIERLPNFVDVGHFAPPPQAERPPVAVCVGRLAREKNLAMLLRAFASAARGIVEARLILVGGGPEEPTLRQLATDLGISGRVEFAGAQTDVRPFLRRAGFAVSATLGEGLSNALLEQVSCGLGVAMPDVGGARDVLGEPLATADSDRVARVECGVLVSVGDEGSLAAGMRLLFESGELRRELAEKSRIRAVQHFSPDAVLSGLEAIYQRAMRFARKETQA